MDSFAVMCCFKEQIPLLDDMYMLINILLKGDLPTSHPVPLVRSSSLMKVSSCVLFITVLNITIEGHLKLLGTSAEILESGYFVVSSFCESGTVGQRRRRNGVTAMGHLTPMTQMSELHLASAFS